jgi:hypothetical protein
MVRMAVETAGRRRHRLVNICSSHRHPNLAIQRRQEPQTRWSPAPQNNTGRCIRNITGAGHEQYNRPIHVRQERVVDHEQPRRDRAFQVVDMVSLISVDSETRRQHMDSRLEHPDPSRPSRPSRPCGLSPCDDNAFLFDKSVLHGKPPEIAIRPSKRVTCLGPGGRRTMVCNVVDGFDGDGGLVNDKQVLKHRRRRCSDIRNRKDGESGGS